MGTKVTKSDFTHGWDNWQSYERNWFSEHDETQGDGFSLIRSPGENSPVGLVIEGVTYERF